MALRMKISAKDFDKLPEALQDAYKEYGDDYALDVSGIEDTGALKRAKQREAEKRKEFEKRAKEAEDRLADIEGDDARKRGDIETLEKSWNDKISKLESDYSERMSAKDAFIKQTLVDSVASEIAGEFKSPKLMMPHIKSRIAADLDGDNPKTVVLDATGQPSALTVDELKKEFVANPDFSDMIVASRASGGGASTTSSQSASGAPAKSSIDLSKASANDVIKHIGAKHNLQE